MSSDESGSDADVQQPSKIARSRSRPAAIPSRYNDYTLNVSSVEESLTNSKLIVSAVYVHCICMYVMLYIIYVY